ncbi:isochorismate synthase [Maribacter algicola]|uniref:Isochorismate synthase n=1 Tax=Maribacter algicola TaxID=2498892 RepID=A0A3R8WF40_9FLAO|nr:chorismate-binding protein [Maribacter algicola]RRQ48800.1 isochorismate synthase [Maribacter algicola]
MANSLFEKAQNQMMQGLPFVLYKKPKESYVKGIFQLSATLHSVIDFSESGFVFAPFDTAKKPLLMIPDEVVTEAIQSEKSSLKKNLVRSEHLDSKPFESIVSKAIDSIRSGKLEKVVLSRTKDVPISISIFAIFQRLISSYGSAFCYLWYHPEVGTWLGATPEILLKVRGDVFITMSLAGTQLVSGDDTIPVWGKKEYHEQQVVTDYIEQSLKDGVTDLKIGDLETVRAGHLWHLRTKVSGRFIKEKLGTLIESLHPTPAVCGIPKERAKKFIRENEPYDRMFYTGYLGELNLKNEVDRSANTRNTEQKAYRSVMDATELYVNLRCMKMNGNRATLFVGGGITSDSDPWKEWEETENKSQTLLSVLLD